MKRRAVSLMLTVALTVTGLNLGEMADSIYAAQLNEAAESKAKEAEKKITEVMELAGERTENTNTYLMSDGTKKLEVFGDNIRYREKGKWKEYDSSLKEISKNDEKQLNVSCRDVNDINAGDYRYVNTRGDSRQYFSEQLDEKHPIIMNSGNYSISFTPVLENKEKTGIKNAKSDDAGQTMGMTNGDELNSTSEDCERAEYSDKKRDIKYVYTSLNNGVKEEIVLERKPENNTFEYRYDLKGIEPVKYDDNYIVLIDKKDGDAVASISAPYVSDADGNRSYDDVSMELDGEEENGYTIRLTVSEEYLNDEDRYPVTVDPTVYWDSKTSSNINSYNENPNGAHAVPGSYRFYTGTDSDGYGQTAYIRCSDIVSGLKGKKINYAVFEPVICEISGEPEISIRNAESACDFMSMYGKPKAVVGTKKYGRYICENNEHGDRIALYMTDIVREMVTGNISSYGITLYGENNEKGNHVTFYGTAEEKRPVFYVGYSDTENMNATYDGSLTVSGEAGEDDSKNVINLQWDKCENADVYQIYVRENEGNFEPAGVTFGTEYEYECKPDIKKTDFRVLAIMKSGDSDAVTGEDDRLSNIVSFDRANDETENGGGAYEQVTRDTDGDSLEDGYEIWDFKTYWNKVEGTDSNGENIYNTDSDGDGLPDGYEVFTLGTDPAVANEKDADSDGDGWTDLKEYQKETDPWLYDSDFDGLRDKDDVGDNNPRKTDNPRLKGTDRSVASAAKVHKGLYDREYSENENGVTVTYIANIYKGDIKSIYNDYGDAKINKRQKYFYDAKGNNTAIVEQYDDNDAQTICITYTYDENGNVEFICDQQTKYTMEYNSDNRITNLQVGDRTLVSYEYSHIQGDSGNESGESTGASVENTDEQITYYGTGDDRQKVRTVTTEYEADSEDDAAVAEKTEVFYNDEKTPSYVTTVNSSGQMLSLTDNTESTQLKYNYEYNDGTTRVTRSDGFIKEVVQNEDEENKKSTLTTKYEYKALDDEKETLVSKIETDSSDGDKIKNRTTLYNGDVLSETMSDDGKSCVTNLYSDKYKKNILKYNSVEDDSTHRTFDIEKYGENKNIDYTYDRAGNITKIKTDGKLTNAYEYDAHGRLTWEYDYDVSRAYEYGYATTGNVEAKHTYVINDNGRLVEQDDEVKKYSYGNSDWPDQLTKYCGKEITYDSSGNPKEYYNGMSFNWYRGRQLQETTLANGNRVTYNYNEDGLRTYKDTVKTTSTYEWDETKLIRETVTYKKTGKKYDIWYMYDSGNNVIGFEYSQLSELNETLKTTRVYYEKNLQGDVTGLLDARGAEIASYTYDAWGKVITDTEKSFCYEGYEIPFELNHVLYRGYYHDGNCTDTESDTNLYYLQSRYYDVEVGRFINADDVSIFDVRLNAIFQDNLYCYCNGNPVNFADKGGFAITGTFKGKIACIHEIANLIVTVAGVSYAYISLGSSLIKFAVAGQIFTLGLSTGVTVALIIGGFILGCTGIMYATYMASQIINAIAYYKRYNKFKVKKVYKYFHNTYKVERA